MAKTTIRTSLAGVQSDAIPESRIFGGGGDETCPESLRGKHLNGTPVEEIPDVWRYLTPDRTDEGLAARNSASSAVVVADGGTAFDKQIEQRAEHLANNVEPWATKDPIGEGVKAHVPAGYRGKLLDGNRVSREGNYGRGWEVVKDAQGQPVRVGGDYVGIMPEETAKRRNAHYVEQDRKRVRVNDEQAMKDKMEKLGVTVTTNV